MDQTGSMGSRSAYIIRHYLADAGQESGVHNYDRSENSVGILLAQTSLLPLQDLEGAAETIYAVRRHLQ